MTALIRAELMALRTLRSTYAVAAAAILLAAVITWAGMAEAGSTSLDSTRELRDALVMASGLVSALFVAVFAALRTAGEYRRARSPCARSRAQAARCSGRSGSPSGSSAAARRPRSSSSSERSWPRNFSPA